MFKGNDMVCKRCGEPLHRYDRIWGIACGGGVICDKCNNKILSENYGNPTKREIDVFLDNGDNNITFIRLCKSVSKSLNYFNLSVPARMLYKYIDCITCDNEKSRCFNVIAGFATTVDEAEKVKDLLEELYTHGLMTIESEQ